MRHLPIRAIGDTTTSDLFKPWSIPAEAMRAAGVDPETAEPNRVPGAPWHHWQICTWSANWYFLTIFVTTHTLHEVKQVPVNHGFVEVEIPNRNAYSYVHGSPDRNTLGDIVFAVTGGTVHIRVATKITATAQEDPRATALRIASLLNEYLPR